MSSCKEQCSCEFDLGQANTRHPLRWDKTMVGLNCCHETNLVTATYVGDQPINMASVASAEIKKLNWCGRNMIGVGVATLVGYGLYYLLLDSYSRGGAPKEVAAALALGMAITLGIAACCITACCVTPCLNLRSEKIQYSELFRRADGQVDSRIKAISQSQSQSPVQQSPVQQVVQIVIHNKSDSPPPSYPASIL